tara:strand:- start:687 stop:1265 length:579 start_codon:yes stop_codon:yes gene_type:complete
MSDIDDEPFVKSDNEDLSDYEYVDDDDNSLADKPIDDSPEQNDTDQHALNNSIIPDEDPIDSSDDENIEHLHKIRHLKESISTFHRDQNLISLDDVKPFLYTKRNKFNKIIDEHHKSTPILTKFEKTKVIGFRAIQLTSGAPPFIDIPSHIHDPTIIANMELNAKKIPFIIKRPISSSSFEYWLLSELEIIE